MVKHFSKFIQFIALHLIKGYQIIITPFIAPSCRHQPSCSHYASDAIKNHGALRGLRLTGKRLLRCHPWGTSGWDPVPLKKPNQSDCFLFRKVYGDARQPVGTLNGWRGRRASEQQKLEIEMSPAGNGSTIFG